jgi:hypothetical protein
VGGLDIPLNLWYDMNKQSRIIPMSSDPRSIDFDYKKYSLKQLNEWVNDALNCENFTPQEIYDTITKSVKENIEYHQKELDKSKEFLSLMNKSEESNITYGTYADWTNFWEENYYPEEARQYTEEELDAMCDAAAEQEERDKCREYNLREAQYYNQRAKLDADYEKSKHYYDTNRNK